MYQSIVMEGKLEVVSRVVTLHIDGSPVLQIYRRLLSMLDQEGIHTLIQVVRDGFNLDCFVLDRPAWCQA